MEPPSERKSPSGPPDPLPPVPPHPPPPPSPLQPPPPGEAPPPDEIPTPEPPPSPPKETENRSVPPPLPPQQTIQPPPLPPEMAGKDPPWLPGRPDDAEEHPVDPQWITLRRLGNLIRTTILGLMGLTGTLIFLGLVGWSSAAKLTFLAGVAGFFCALYILGMITPVLAYRRYRWRLDGETLLVRRGIWWRIETLVPKSRIQHTDVTQGPLERLFHTSSLVVHTAGTRFAIVEVDGLPTGLAPKMRDHLLDLRPDESL